MTDQFPTLEAAATLGFAVLLWRAILLGRDAAATSELNDELVEMLKRGQLSPALKRCEAAGSVTYARLARRVLLAGANHPAGAAAEELEHALKRARDAEHRALRRRTLSGRARDLVVLAVLVGAVLYGLSGQLGLWFVAMAAGGGLLTIISVLLRHQVASRSREASATLLAPTAEAAHAERERESAPSTEACPSCNEETLARVREPGRLRLPAAEDRQQGRAETEVDLLSLRICPSCGHVQGRVEDPEKLPIEATSEQGAAGPEPEPED